ncbi:tetratricopeptide repeat protein [Zeimonas arvi]|uniref:Uncharacterized protein n=1 Tax=Zeimonas arvi TaxID=2498847 RepID=A0A5C8NXX0_9BURK|nr:hypothetical protein [Zeimonas arvi]TXL65961.1 hypothetical protein FHP08_07735 [Zeimonas arvi]
MRQAAASVILCAFATLAPAQATAQTRGNLPASPTGLCGSIENAFGPFDYRTSPLQRKRLVERHHFTPKVESLRAGETGSVGGDLDYTLRAFPNHPRALLAMVRLGERERTSQVRGANYPVECYFDRAIRFQPDDPQVRVLYAYYLTRNKRPGEARRQLEAAESTSPTDPQVIYNLGLAYLDLNEYDRALAYAHKAYDAGITFPGLRERLKRANKWQEARK